jgi:cell division protein FtsI (penicillin-binding protein 3)
VSSFAAVFPTDGPLTAPRYFVLILLDEPQRGGGPDPTGGIVAAPAAGRVIERIAPFLGVKRRAETMPFAPPAEVAAAANAAEEH